MRKRRSKGGLTVNAIAGAHVVLLGWTIADADRANLRGFAVRRTDHAEGETYWMKGSKTFKSVNPFPAPGEQFSSLLHPFQTFQWADYSATPDRDYDYEVVALYGNPARMTRGASVKLAVHTEPVTGTDHSVFFNRGSPATQEYARRFQNKPPSVAGPGAYQWLSRGLLESILVFIARAMDADWSLKGAFYEFQWPAVLNALAAAHARGAGVSIVFDAIASTGGPEKKNRAAIAEATLDALCIPRTHGTLMHNKFLVLSRGTTPVALLFGSTNLTENGIFGHANCIHVVEGAEPAATYLKYYDALAIDPLTTRASTYKADNVVRSPAPLPLSSHAMAPVFSPRSGLEALDWYADLAGKAKNGLFMTFAFGMHPLFIDVYAKTDGILRMALMEKEWNGQNKGVQIARIRALQALPNVVIAIGNRIPLTGFDQWLGELDHVTDDVHVHWIHTKFALIDPLSNNPIVITGSANFSKASTDANDENMLVIRGNTRVADIYIGEFFRLHSHYAFRQAVGIFEREHSNASPSDFEVRFLTEDRDWTADYFTPNDRNARFVRRMYFSGS